MVTWTVKKLIEELRRVENQNLPVMTEGCDCHGVVTALDIYTGLSGTEVLLIRRYNDELDTTI